MINSTEEAIKLLDFYMKPLESWLKDPKTEDIAINKPHSAWVYQDGRWSCHDVDLSYEDLESLAIITGSLRHREVSEESPLCDEKLPNGERLSICLPPVVPQDTVALTFRKHEDHAIPLESSEKRYITDGWNQWREDRMTRNLDRSLAAYDSGNFLEFLQAAVYDRLNIIFVGATGVGKTTLAKSLLNAINRDERVITVEDTEELAGLPDNHVRLLYSKGGLSRTDISHEQLLQAAMRMRPRRIIVGEMRDDAVLTWVTEACTGHPGSITTLHGSNAREAVRRISHLVKSSPIGANFDVAELLGDTIDVIIPLYELEKQQDGKTRGIGAVWFSGDAMRRGQSVSDLFRDNSFKLRRMQMDEQPKEEGA
jgi:type IV secretion system protein VirB11